jgi:predicted esterase
MPYSTDRIVIERSISTSTHGRYLVVPAQRDGPAPLLVGFHGYAEPAETQLERLRAVPGSETWTIVSIQGLHRFYRRGNDTVVASWMTRQDRELAIADNLAYVDAVVTAEWAARFGSRVVVYAGFSQGVAMAFRAASRSAHPVGGVIGVGGDIPPELDRAALSCLGHVLICRGSRDEWYSSEKFEQDQKRLRDAVVDFSAVQFEGGHEWSGDAVTSASRFLASRLL